MLFHFDVLHHLGFLLGSSLRDDYGKDAVGNACRNLVALYVVRQSVALLIVAIGEFAAQVAFVSFLTAFALSVFLLVLHLVLNGHV